MLANRIVIASGGRYSEHPCLDGKLRRNYHRTYAYRDEKDIMTVTLSACCRCGILFLVLDESLDRGIEVKPDDSPPPPDLSPPEEVV